MKALEIVRYFIKLHKSLISSIEKSDETEQSEEITHLKIQKLLYYAQGLNLTYEHKPLYPQSLEAWQHGPVVKEVYDKLKIYGRDDLQDIQELQYTKDTLTLDEKSIVEMAFREYGRYTASYLRNKTHEEPAWKNAWQRGKNSPISHDEMREYFTKEQRQKAEILYSQSKDYRWLFS